MAVAARERGTQYNVMMIVSMSDARHHRLPEPGRIELKIRDGAGLIAQIGRAAVPARESRYRATPPSLKLRKSPRSTFCPLKRR